MKKYNVMYINGNALDSNKIVEAKSASDAVYKAFNVKAKRSRDFQLDYCVNILGGRRKTYLKKEIIK